MATELKPCPHCGQTKTLEVVAAVDLLCDEDERDAYTHSDSFGVVCSAAKPDGPGGCGAMGGFMPTREAAAEAWNRRTQPAPQQAEAVPKGEPVAWTTMGQIRFTPPTSDHATYTPLYRAAPVAKQAKAVQQWRKVVPQWRRVGCVEWYDGYPDHSDGDVYETRALYTAPQPKEGA